MREAAKDNFAFLRRRGAATATTEKNTEAPTPTVEKRKREKATPKAATPHQEAGRKLKSLYSCILESKSERPAHVTESIVATCKLPGR